MRFAHDDATEKHRAECEARYWIKHHNNDTDAIAETLRRIAGKRGRQVAEELRDEIRRQRETDSKQQAS